MPPAELEGLLITHPDVADAGVIGVQVNEQELPRAYIVLKKPTKDVAAQRLVAKEVQEWIKPRVGKPKHLRGGVIVIPEIPKRSSHTSHWAPLRVEADPGCCFFSPSGKILRKILRERALKEVLEASKQPISTRL